MKTNSAPVTPPVKKIKKMITGFTMYILGAAIQTACALDSDAAGEARTWPDPYRFALVVEPHGPAMVMEKRGGRLVYARGSDAAGADITVCLKNIEFAFRMMTGLLSNSEIVWQNRQYVRGDLNMMMSIMRCIEIAQTIIFPGFIARRYIKKVPGFTLRRILNRVIFYAAGLHGFIK